MSNDYGLDDVDRELMVAVRKAVAGYNNGDPVKDFIDDDQMVEAMVLLVRIMDTGTAK